MGDGASSTTLNQNKKMIAETKDFKTITLRGLEEKPEVVKIMNDVMTKEGLKTGQSVIEFIITDYDKKAKELEAKKEKYENFYHNHYKVVDRQEKEIETLKAALKALKNAFQLINSIED